MKKEKRKKLWLFLLIVITILSVVIIKPLGDLDELWNYNFARNVTGGLIPYKDFNIVVTPFLAIITGIVLKLTVNQLFMMRILTVLLCSSIFYLIYKTFNLLKIKNEVSVIFTFFIIFLFKDFLCIDYNWATLLLVLVISYAEINNYNKHKNILEFDTKYELLLGMLAGITFTLKQTSGLLICIAFLGNKLFFVRNKKELIVYFKSFIFRLIGVIIPIIILVIYLVLNNAFKEFISYTIKGTSGFTNYIPYRNLIHSNLIGLCAILVPISFLYAWYKAIIREKDKNIYFLLVYGLAIFIITFPISDKIHFLIGSTPTIISILYELYNMIKSSYDKLIKDNEKTKKILNITIHIFEGFITIFLLTYIIFNLKSCSKNQGSYSKLNHYKYIPISKKLEEQVNVIDDYIINNDKDVKILDASAVLYMIPINRYNKDYDMFNKGNFGYKGEERLIEEISSNINTQYLILNDKYSKNWQTPINIIEYIKNNKTKVGEVEIFDVYE